MSDINTNRFELSLSGDEFITMLKALYWYDDKLTNMERSKGRDNYERDIVVYLRSKLAKQLEKEAFI
jgi:hypothetical protein